MTTSIAVEMATAVRTTAMMMTVAASAVCWSSSAPTPTKIRVGSDGCQDNDHGYGPADHV